MQFVQKLGILRQKKKRLMKDAALADVESAGRYSLEEQYRTNSTTGQHLSLSNATFKELSNNSYTEMGLKQKKTKSQRPRGRFMNSFQSDSLLERPNPYIGGSTSYANVPSYLHKKLEDIQQGSSPAKRMAASKSRKAISPRSDGKGGSINIQINGGVFKQHKHEHQ